MKDLFGNPDEEAIYQYALSMPLDKKISKAIAMIREYEPMALQISDDGYYVAFSGGKDSIVMERLFEMAGVKYKAWYNNVTIDPPELVKFIKEQYPLVGWNNPKKNLIRECTNQSIGLPTRKFRWCCKIYKENGGKGNFRAIGVRAAESARRKGIWQPIGRFNNDPIMSPILYWTENDVWTFIKSNHMPYCSLYDEGYKRLGCVGCPMGNRKSDFKRWPKYEVAWKKAAKDWYEKYSTKKKKDGGDYSLPANFRNWEHYWSWWMEERSINDTDQPDCQMWLW